MTPTGTQEMAWKDSPTSSLIARERDDNRAALRDMAQDRRALGPARLPRQRSERGLHQTSDADA